MTIILSEYGLLKIEKYIAMRARRIKKTWTGHMEILYCRNTSRNCSRVNGSFIQIAKIYKSFFLKTRNAHLIGTMIQSSMIPTVKRIPEPLPKKSLYKAPV
jgi:hypothetical protein